MRNPLHTRLCDMFGVQYPIVAFTHCKDVAAAVTNAGGIGVYGALGHTPDELNEDVRWMRERVGDKPFGIDLVFPASVPEKSLGVEGYSAQISDAHWKFVDSIRQQYQVPERSAAAVAARPTNRGGGGFMSQENGRRQAETLIDLKVPILASGLGSPTFILDAAHANGVKVFGLIGKVRQARREIEAGVDVIVAQGHDAGGHNSPIGTFSLVPQVVRIAGDTPVLCAGGVGTGEHLVAAIAMGAVGAWTGSIWLTSHESDENLFVKEKIVAATEDDTIVTKALTGKPARLIKNAWTMAWEAPNAPKPLPMPLQSMVGAELLAAARDANMGEFMGSGLGQVIGTITQMKSCRSIIEDIMTEAQDVLESRFGIEG